MADIIFERGKTHKRKFDSDNADYLRVVGAGLPRTGTSSLKAALELLGFGPCHHMSELFDKPEQSIQYTRAFDGHKTNFYGLLKGYGSTVDAPTVFFYKEIHQAYPKAKIILTVRDSDEKWYASLKNTIGATGTDIFYYTAIYSIRFLRLQCSVARRIHKKWMAKYGEIGPRIHELHNARVIKENEGHKLLVFNVKEGWSPLWKFLDIPIPNDIPFPNVNDAESIQLKLQKARTIGWSAWGCIVAVTSIVIYFCVKRLDS